MAVSISMHEIKFYVTRRVWNSMGCFWVACQYFSFHFFAFNRRLRQVEISSKTLWTECSPWWSDIPCRFAVSWFLSLFPPLNRENWAIINPITETRTRKSRLTLKHLSIQQISQSCFRLKKLKEIVKRLEKVFNWVRKSWIDEPAQSSLKASHKYPSKPSVLSLECLALCPCTTRCQLFVHDCRVSFVIAQHISPSQPIPFPIS